MLINFAIACIMNSPYNNCRSKGEEEERRRKLLELGVVASCAWWWRLTFVRRGAGNHDGGKVAVVGENDGEKEEVDW